MNSTSYGSALAEKIRTENKNFTELTVFEKFVVNNGYRYDTREALDSGFYRYTKYDSGELLSEVEFLEETDGEGYSTETLRNVYSILAEMVNEGKIKAPAVYQYACFKWCLHSPDAIVAYENVETDNWIVNNCDSKISEEEAILKINREWGFEASRIQIIGIPYYEASDWQFIRFDCAGVSWLWTGEYLYNVYED